MRFLNVFESCEPSTLFGVVSMGIFEGASCDRAGSVRGVDCAVESVRMSAESPENDPDGAAAGT